MTNLRSNIGSFETRVLRALLTGVTVIAVSGCATASAPYVPPAGLSSLTGWNGAYYDNAGHASAIDINGEIGHPLFVKGSTANCTPGDWTANNSVVSGSLPPGVVLGYQGEHGGIGGIPTRRGHFIVTMAKKDISCNGKSYLGFTQELRFHITGSGEVVQ